MQSRKGYSCRQLVSVQSRLFRVFCVSSTFSPSPPTPIMPSIRSPLASNSTNRRSNTELTLYQRGEIIGYRATGQSQYQIAAHVGLSQSTIQYTLNHQNKRLDGLSTPRTEHPLKLTARETRSMLHYIQIYPKMTFAERRAHYDTKISNSHIKNICREAGLTH